MESAKACDCCQGDGEVRDFDGCSLVACDLCRGAGTLQKRQGKRGPVPYRPCGTVAAYKRHRRAGEQPCAACAAAWAAEQRRLYAKRKARDE